MRLKVYYNLHKHCFSALEYSQAKKGWRLFKHFDELTLVNVSFKVSEAGRLRVLATKEKNVHAFVIGNLVFEDYVGKLTNEAFYNPYKVSTFCDKATGFPVLNASWVKLKDRQIQYLPF